MIVEMPDGRVVDFGDLPEDEVNQIIAREMQPQQPQQESPGFMSQLMGNLQNAFSPIAEFYGQAVPEFAAAANRGLMQGFDFLGPGTANAALRLAGSDYQMPTLSGMHAQTPGSQGGFMPPGTARDVVQAGGEVGIPFALGGLPVARNTASPLGAAAEFLGLGTARAPQAGVAPVLFDQAPANLPAPIPGVDAPPAPAVGRLGDMFQERAVNREARPFIEAGVPDIARAGRNIDPYTGRVVSNEAGQAAIKQGVDPEFVAMIQTSSPETKSKMKQMMDALLAGKRNVMERSRRRPFDIVGDSMIDRLDVIKEVNNKAKRELNAVAQSLKGRYVDPAPAVDQFIADLDDLGVNVNLDGGVSLGFQGSDVEGLEGNINAIMRMVKRMANTQAPDAYDLHRLKRYIDENVSYTTRTEGMTGTVESIIKNLRRNIDGILDENFPQYNSVNTDYSTTIEPLKELQRLIGKNNNPFSDLAPRTIGTLMRRIESNAVSGPQVTELMEQMNDVAKRYTGTGTDVATLGSPGRLSGPVRNLNDDIRAQVLFADELNKLFKTPAGTSFQGEIAKAMDKAAVDMASMRSPGLGEMAGEAVRYGINKMRRVDEERMIEALLKLLEQQ